MSSKKDRNQEHIEEALICDQMHFDAKEAYKRLCTNVIYSLPDKRCRKVGITSAEIADGKSTVAINLAYTLSAAKSKVLLIELDLRLPTISKKLDLSYDHGLVDFLAGRVTDKEILVHTTSPYWDVIFSGPTVPNPPELIASEKLKTFVNKLELYYDYIIFDLPPVNVVTDALAAKDLLDGYILVVRENHSDKHSLMECVKQLDFLDATILGFILVDSSSRDASYRRKYYSKYGRKHYYGRYNKYYGYYGHSSHNHSKEVEEDND